MKSYILIQSLILLLYSNTIFDGIIPLFRNSSYHNFITILHHSLLEEASSVVNLFMNLSLPDDGCGRRPKHVVVRNRGLIC
jgi:hypothetical protein